MESYARWFEGYLDWKMEREKGEEARGGKKGVRMVGMIWLFVGIEERRIERDGLELPLKSRSRSKSTESR